MSMPLKGAAALWNQVSSSICASRDRVEGWNSSIHLLMVASAALARMMPGIAKPAPATAVDIRNRRRPKCHLVTSVLSLSLAPGSSCRRAGRSPPAACGRARLSRTASPRETRSPPRSSPTTRPASVPISQPRWIQAAPSSPMNSRSPRVVDIGRKPRRSVVGWASSQTVMIMSMMAMAEKNIAVGHVQAMDPKSLPKRSKKLDVHHTRPRAKPLAM